MGSKELIDYCLQKLTDAGFEKAAIHLIEKDKQELNAEKNKIKLLRGVQAYELSLIGIIDQKRAVITITDVEKASIDTAVNDAWQIANSSKQDPAYDISPAREIGTYESAPFEPDLDKMHLRMEEFLEHTKQVYPSIIMDCILAHELVTHHYSNTNGVYLTSKIGGYGSSIFFVAQEGQQSSSFNFTWFDTKDLETPIIELSSVDRVLREATEQTETQLLPEKFEGDMIIAPDCGDFMSFVTQQLFDDALISGTSLYKDKLDNQILDSRFTISSNPKSPEEPGGYFITNDGFEAENAVIIDKGKLKHFFLGNYGAKKTGLPIGPNRAGSMHTAPGDTPYAEMLKQVKKGILLSRFSGGVPSPNGDFSGIAKNSYYIEDGEIKFPLSETMISGNIAKMLLDDVVNISQETVKFGSNEGPWIHVRNVSISGK